MAKVRRQEYATPDEAEKAFYDAFEERNISHMMDVWEDDDSSVCIHPLTGHISGWESIRKSWARLFKHSPQITIKTSDCRRTLANNLAVHTLYEHIHVQGDKFPQPAIISTNIYQLTQSGWHMILHHASPTTQPSNKDEDIRTLH